MILAAAERARRRGQQEVLRHEDPEENHTGAVLARISRVQARFRRWRLLHNLSRARGPPAGVETMRARTDPGGERPSAIWWCPTPLHNVVHGLLRT